jgi:hypothetical protein
MALLPTHMSVATQLAKLILLDCLPYQGRRHLVDRRICLSLRPGQNQNLHLIHKFAWRVPTFAASGDRIALHSANTNLISQVDSITSVRIGHVYGDV